MHTIPAKCRSRFKIVITLTYHRPTNWLNARDLCGHWNTPTLLHQIINKLQNIGGILHANSNIILIV